MAAIARPKSQRVSKLFTPTTTVRSGRKPSSPKMVIALGRPASEAPNVAAIRGVIRFSQPEFGELTSYSTRAVAEWERGKLLDRRALRKVTEVDRLLKALSELMPPNRLGQWLRQANNAFGGLSPVQLIQRGESDRLWQMVHQIDANVAN